MARTKWLFAYAMLAFAMSAALPSRAQTVTLPFSAEARLAGVDIQFPIAATLTRPLPFATIPFVAEADLADLILKIDDIIRSAGLHLPPGSYQSFGYNGTILQVAGDRLWAKYHFRIDPHNARPTNGSVEMYFRAIIEANALRLAAEEARLNISNDIARLVVRGLELDTKLIRQLLGEINAFLASPDARLHLPPELVAADTALGATRFANIEGRQVLVVEGTLEITLSLFNRLVNRLLP
ncbi:MAG TPA: hypothetical protein VHG92_04165 [Afifellaceae bacterium]|nr:hypothetical protein [Afifellaceae bacterium]